MNLVASLCHNITRAQVNGVILKSPTYLHSFTAGEDHEPGRVRVVKLVLTVGTTQACKGGQPASVVGLRQSDAVAGLTSEEYTVLSSGSAYTW